MADFTLKEGQFSLWPNKDKTADNQPDMTGTIMLNGREMRIAVWNRVSKNDKPYLSGQVSEKREKQQRTCDTPPEAQRIIDNFNGAQVTHYDNDVPF